MFAASGRAGHNKNEIHTASGSLARRRKGETDHMELMTSEAFVKRLKKIAEETATLYVNGCFGAPLTGGNVETYCRHTAYNRRPERSAMIRAAGNKNPPVFGFDCICLIKGVLWGWTGDAGKVYGGAVYRSNGVEDMTLDAMLGKCGDVSADFGSLMPGEYLWSAGHAGVYAGNGLAVECTPAWKNGVQLTAVANLGAVAGYPSRRWSKHGKLPYVSYPAAGAECDVTLPVLRRGMTGDAVRALQALLIGKFGISCGASGTDGSFGPATEAAVRALQNTLALSSDGIVGKLTWGGMIGYVK